MVHDFFVKLTVLSDFPHKEGPSEELVRWSSIVRVTDKGSRGSRVWTREGFKLDCKEKPHEIFDQHQKPHRFGETAILQ